jgi:hypothetical protein
MTYGPWTIAPDTQPIYHSIFADRTTVTVIPTTNPAWVLKITATSVEVLELSAVLLLYSHMPRNCVEFPQKADLLCGTAPGHVWYAMRRYTGSAAIERDFSRTHWQALAHSVLLFLEDLHTITRHIHGDIKLSNILVDVERCGFVVADFGHIDVPNEKRTMDYDVDYRGYYLAQGAELDRPLKSWRMDLTALGFMLAELTWPMDVDRTFYDDCLMLRNGDIIDENELITRRGLEMSWACCATLRAYFETLNRGLSWDAASPPPHSLYRSLMSVFV